MEETMEKLEKQIRMERHSLRNLLRCPFCSEKEMLYYASVGRGNVVIGRSAVCLECSRELDAKNHADMKKKLEGDHHFFIDRKETKYNSIW